MKGYDCGTCGQHHDELPMHYGVKAPLRFFLLDDAARDLTLINADQCVLEKKDFYLYGNLQIAVEGVEERFSWDVWVQVSRQDFARACEVWETPGRESEPPFPGTLATAIPCYPDTLGLPVLLRTRAVGLRPLVELADGTHPLIAEQRGGITPARVQQIAEAVLHG